MATGVAQTAGTWMLSPGRSRFSADCLAALVACGIDPDGFGSYDSVADRISDAKASFNGAPYDASSSTENRHSEFLTSQSQSGHMVQNAVFQAPGSRGNPCTNSPPANLNDPNAPSAFGYTDGGAPCTMHYGNSSLYGTCHGNVTLVVERSYDPADAGQPFTQDQMRNQATASAREQANWNRDRYSDLQSRDRDQVERLANAQQAASAQLSGSGAAAGSLGAVAPPANGTPATPEAAAAQAANQQKAAECISADWATSMADWRQSVINQSSGAQSADPTATPEVNALPFSALTPEQQRSRLRASGQFPPGDPLRPPTPPAPPQTPAQCLEYQANHLAWQQASSGSPPPWGGRNPGRTNGRVEERNASSGGGM